MRSRCSTRIASHFLLILTAGLVSAAEEFTPLFNGRDLAGWTNVNCAPETWTIRGDTVRCTGFPTGALRTTRMYENFVLELEWRHLKSGGNAGVFVWAGPIGAQGVPFLRAVEVQVLDHGYVTPYLDKSYTPHGDVFPIHGSTMKPFPPHRGQRSFPSERRGKPSPEWNHYRVEANDGTLWLWVNGYKVSGGEHCNWRKGYLALESEGSPVEFRNVRLRELPSTNATRAETASEAAGHRSLYTGTDLRGWSPVGAVRSRWGVQDWQLRHEGGEGREGLRSEAAFGDVEFIVDCKPDDHGRIDGEVDLRGAVVPLSILRAGGPASASVLKRASRGFHRLEIRLRGSRLTVLVNGSEVLARDVPKAEARGPILLTGGAAGFVLSGLYVREL
jgi:hypothetical protein